MASHSSNSRRDDDARDAQCNPVDPKELYQRLCEALGVDSSRVPTSGKLTLGFPSLETSVSEFRDSYLLCEVMRKYPIEGTVDTRRVALDGWYVQEQVNASTNDRIRNRDFGDFDPRVREVYYLSCRKAAAVLGPINWELFSRGLRFGPKASTRIRGGDIPPNISRKLHGKPEVTTSAFGMAMCALTESPMWAYKISACVSPEVLLTIREYEVVDTVPKDAETDRTIGIQPDMNILFQLSAGNVMRYSLEKVGINLNRQSINQARAKSASCGTRNATVDLKGASDSIVEALVYDHLAYCGGTTSWFDLLDTIRCRCAKVDGKILTLEKFSAMGCGFTFELESLIFWSLTTATCEVLGVTPDVTVFGDDIICPSEVIPLLKDVFAFCGFTVNDRKSHWSHDQTLTFRESCGMHYVNGVDVSPFYIDYKLDVPEKIILTANNLLRWAKIPGWGKDGRLKGVYDWITSHLSERCLKTAIPWGEANDGLIKDFDEAVPPVVRTGPSLTGYKFLDSMRDGTCKPFFYEIPVPVQRIGYRCKTFDCKTSTTRIDGHAGYLVWHYFKSFTKYRDPLTRSLGSKGHFGNIDWCLAEPYNPYKAPRSNKVSRRFGRRTVDNWESIGPWVFPE